MVDVAELVLGDAALLLLDGVPQACAYGLVFKRQAFQMVVPAPVTVSVRVVVESSAGVLLDFDQGVGWCRVGLDERSRVDLVAWPPAEKEGKGVSTRLKSAIEFGWSQSVVRYFGA